MLNCCSELKMLKGNSVNFFSNQKRYIYEENGKGTSQSQRCAVKGVPAKPNIARLANNVTLSNQQYQILLAIDFKKIDASYVWLPLCSCVR